MEEHIKKQMLRELDAEELSAEQEDFILLRRDE